MDARNTETDSLAAVRNRGLQWLIPTPDMLSSQGSNQQETDASGENKTNKLPLDTMAGLLATCSNVRNWATDSQTDASGDSGEVHPSPSDSDSWTTISNDDDAEPDMRTLQERWAEAERLFHAVIGPAPPGENASSKEKWEWTKKVIPTIGIEWDSDSEERIREVDPRSVVRNRLYQYRYPLHSAVQNDNIQQVQHLLASPETREDIDKTDDQNMPALGHAIVGQSEAMVQALVNAGANVNLQLGKTGLTLLHLACSKSTDAVVKVLLNSKADPNASFPPLEGVTSLLGAAELGHASTVRLLLDYGANVDIQGTQDSKSALQAAVVSRNVETVKVLLRHGAKVDQRLYKNKTVLHLATHVADKAILKALLDAKSDINAEDDAGITPLWVAVTEKNLDIARMLLKGHADPNRRNKTYPGALLDLAAGHQPPQLALEFIRLLLQHNADPNAPWDAQLYQRLLAESQHTVVLSEEDKSKTKDGGDTPFHHWVKRKDLEDSVAADGVRCFLEHGADVNARIAGDIPPLLVTIILHHPQTALLLIKHTGIDLNARPQRENTDRHPSPLYAAVTLGLHDVVRSLVEAHADVEAGDRDRTPLYEASRRGDLGAVNLLLSAGANVCRRSNGFDTALGVATRSSKVEVVQCLLKARARMQAEAYGTPMPQDEVFEPTSEWFDETVTEALAESDPHAIRREGGLGWFSKMMKACDPIGEVSQKQGDLAKIYKLRTPEDF